MVEIEEAASYLAQNIGYVVTIIGTGFVAAKYIISEIHKKHDRLKKEIMGPELNAREGKGGAIDDLRTELKKDMALMEARIDVKINKAHSDIISEFRLQVQKINYVVSNVSRMERSLEKLTDGRYTSARQETNREDGYNPIDNPDPGDRDDSSLNSMDNYNKRRTRG